MVATQKLPQILQLNPSNEIVFFGPFDKVVTAYLHLKNPSSDRVCFKIKTTAPRRYCVRPNNGTIEPNGEIRIAIMLQPMEEDSQAERSKHKFMVLSTVISEEDSTTGLDEIWQKATNGVMDSKLRCVFQTPSENADSTSPKKKLQDDDLVGGGKPTPNLPSQVAAAMADEPTITTSTPVVSRATSSTTKSWAGGSPSARGGHKSSTETSELKFADKSVASSHNLTSSFLQPMSDDYKIVLISLAMLFLGVILGRYII